MRNISRRLNGWQKINRQRHVIAKQLKLINAEYRLWDLLIALYDWDKTHLETYGTIEITDRQLADLLGWSAPTVCRTRNTLLKKGLIEKIQQGIYGVNTSIVHNPNASVKQILSSTTEGNASMQQDQGYSNDFSFVSSKVNSASSNTEDRYESLTSDDINWINENLKG